MEWIKRRDGSPHPDKRVLVFSPTYDGDPLRFRVMDGKAFKNATDATHWAHLAAPRNDQD